ncbi:ASCH domain-containing protein [Bacillus suaedae]|uniref:ASCH domain-containing protein n=1 Tax=Halalkalibacter suaedae TaxID=2822140 RepID=A0A940WWD1_9BACI|nr:ASCH domain-containing protein [Bacillus suaedae]MBP3951812.1 ASCH domain-containing protein [Bacillus suaedae]
MNNKAQQFFNEFCLIANKKGIECKEAFQFGTSADWLSSLVVENKKTATTSAFLFYELENEALPKVGEYNIVLDAQEEPVSVIQIQSVEVVPMNEVTEEFALAEGEGDYRYWWEAHETFFTGLLKENNMEFSPEMLVVCERFTNVYSKKQLNKMESSIVRLGSS